MMKLWLQRLSALIVLCACSAPGISAQVEIDLLNQLRADYRTLSDAKLEFKQAGNNQNVTSQEQTDYANWIQQLSEQFAHSCRTVSNNSIVSIPADIPCDEYISTYTDPVKIDTNNEVTDSEKTAILVEQFNGSLGEFDEKLLRDQDRVKARRPQTDHTNSASSGAVGDSGSESAVASANRNENQDPQDEAPSDQQRPIDDQDGSASDNPSGIPSDIPDDIPDGSDDDVIARQLREAAEQEQDPELKKKLWQEYKRYKNGQ